MPAIAYTVIATLPDEATASEYLTWLASGHVTQVVRHGASSGMIVRIEDPPVPVQVEARYMFPTREAYEGYIRGGAATRLRAEGAARFSPERGVTFERRAGAVR